MSKPLNPANWRYDKIVTLKQAKQIAREGKKQGKKLVTINGSFDLLHVGHLDQLEEAKRQGDILFVGLNSDSSVKGYKGQDRPIITARARAALLAALICVDYVLIIDEPASEVHNVLLWTIKPHVHVNGPNYGQPQDWVEWPIIQEIKAIGHPTIKINDFSTTDIIDKIKGKNL